MLVCLTGHSLKGWVPKAQYLVSRVCRVLTAELVPALTIVETRNNNVDAKLVAGLYNLFPPPKHPSLGFLRINSSPVESLFRRPSWRGVSPHYPTPGDSNARSLVPSPGTNVFNLIISKVCSRKSARVLLQKFLKTECTQARALCCLLEIMWRVLTLFKGCPSHQTAVQHSNLVHINYVT